MRWPRMMRSDEPLAYTVADLAARWQCGESTVRNLIKRGHLTTFRIGTLIRISAIEVERFECQQNTACNDSVAGSLLSGPKTPESPSALQATEADERSTPKIGRARKRKPAGSGKGATVLHGPWAD